MLKNATWPFLILLGVASAGTSADAQGLETLGTRAAAMAAFVAVADDASAVAWNPSGLVSGPIFNLSIDLTRSTRRPPDPPVPDDPAGRQGATLVALGTTPVGLAYYRLSTTSFTALSPAVVETADRQDRQVLVRTLVTSHLGVTVQQSIGDYLTVGTTLKLVRGSVGVDSSDVESWDEAFERADALERDGSTRGDLDLGAMLAAGRVRAGLVVRNTTEPSFGDETSGQASLDRQVRVGVAWGDRWPGNAGTIVSVDADVTRVPHSGGERRDLATGVERWMRGRRIGVRGGVRASTVGSARPVMSVGASYAFRAGLYVDGFVAAGTDHDRGWGLAARVSY